MGLSLTVTMMIVILKLDTTLRLLLTMTMMIVILKLNTVLKLSVIVIIVIINDSNYLKSQNKLY